MMSPPVTTSIVHHRGPKVEIVVVLAQVVLAQHILLPQAQAHIFNNELRFAVAVGVGIFF